MSSLIFLIYTLSVFIMTGVILIVHFVHYPLFDGVGVSFFKVYEARHAKRITFVVLPLMFLELISGFSLLFLPPAFFKIPWLYLSVALTVGTWGSTFFLSVPQHVILSNGFQKTGHLNLIKTNRIRLCLWIMNTLLLSQILWCVLTAFKQ